MRQALAPLPRSDATASAQTWVNLLVRIAEVGNGSGGNQEGYRGGVETNQISRRKAVIKQRWFYDKDR